ncbi:MAG: hypothetical protein H0T51_07795 [Pirellulales bacterium]|nr:hypothetical protein [Pirellulales bacterium]
MRSEVLVIVFALLALAMVATSEAQAHAPVRSFLGEVKPVRKVVKAAAVVTVRAARAAFVIPMRALKNTAAWFGEHRPVRRAVRATFRGAARVVARPLGRSRLRCQ